ncbi:MAG TPA: hypothetical protein VIH57_18915 [Bacteroidales bacterium]
MAKTISEAFNNFHTWLTPNTGETEALKKHRESISSCLKSNYSLTGFFRTGSIGNGTSINGYSDTDYFAVIPTDKLKQNSSSTLTAIKVTLDTRFPSTGVYVDSPAIVCPFGTRASEITEIVPADYIHKSNGYNVYEIPDTNGGWMKASPDAHNEYVRSANSKQGIANKVKPLIRFIKAWKYYRNVPINSFYLELRVTKYALGESCIEYPYDIRALFKYLIDIKLADLQDPMGVSGLISPFISETQKQDSLSKLNTALTRATNANDCEQAGKIQDAFYWWNLLYDNNFPSYN